MTLHVCPTCGGATQHPTKPIDYVAEFRIDSINSRIYRRDVELQLTAKDFALAALLLQNVGAVLTRERIYQSVWPAEKSFHQTRTIDTHIYRVRFKLLLLPEHGWALTPIYGRGYCLRRTLRAAA